MNIDTLTAAHILFVIMNDIAVYIVTARKVIKINAIQRYVQIVEIIIANVIASLIYGARQIHGTGVIGDLRTAAEFVVFEDGLKGGIVIGDRIRE